MVHFFFRFCIVFFSGIALYSNPPPLPPQTVVEISFQEGLKKLLKKNARLLQGKANLLAFEGYKEEADHALVPQINILSFIAPNFESKGNAVRSVRNYKVWGPTLSFQAQLVWPFYSFGKRKLAQKAANQGLKASENLHRSTINHTIFQFKERYLSLIALKKFKQVLTEARERADEILEEAQKQYASGEGKVLRKDISRLKIYSFEIEKLKEEHLANQNAARLALAHLLGERKSHEAKGDEFPDIEEDTLLLKHFIDLSFKENPDLKGLKLGILARKNLLKLEKKGLLPVFFVGGQATANYTSVREKQSSSFAYDTANNTSAGMAAGVNWNFNWGKYRSRLKKAQSEYEKLLAQKKEADTGYPLKVSISFWTMKKNKNIWRLSQQKLKEARRWSLAEFAAYSSGLGSSKDLVESLAAYYLTKREVIEAEYNYLVAWSELALRVGEVSMLHKWPG